MTQPAPERTPEPDTAAKEAAARQRFVAIGLFRLSGVALVMFGFLIMMQRFAWVQGMDAKLMGACFATLGMVQTIVVPRLLLRAWRTPPAP